MAHETLTHKEPAMKKCKKLAQITLKKLAQVTRKKLAQKPNGTIFAFLKYRIKWTRMQLDDKRVTYGVPP